MNGQPNSSNFFDSKTILLMVAVMGILIGWQTYLAKKYPDHFRAKQAAPVEQPERKVEDASPGVPAGPTAKPSVLMKPDALVEVLPEKLVHFDSPTWAFDISSKGMGLRNVTLKKYHDRKDGFVIVGGTKVAPDVFGTLVLFEGESSSAVAPDFEITKLSETEYVGRAALAGGMIEKRLVIQPEQYVVQVEVRADPLPSGFAGIQTGLSKPIDTQSSGMFFLPAIDYQEFFVHDEGGTTRTRIAADEQLSQEYTKVRVAGLGSQYFALALLNKSDVYPRFQENVRGDQAAAVGQVKFPLLQASDSFTAKYLAFAGPKSYNLLKGIDSDLVGLIDFGMFGWVATYIYRLMRHFYELVGNWGWAIVFLTLLVRLIVLPTNILSYRSMKAMQKIQPVMKELRERYKNDRDRLNQEMMKLMRDSKANPLGGCLPMLLQIPIFIALYQVIGQSIELYQAPFWLWIKDLSLPDPYYVLPIAFGLTVFVQQRITPSTLDPAQAKVMLVLPVIFSLMFISVPSGLTLYMLVSAVFGLLQQTIFMKTDKA